MLDVVGPALPGSKWCGRGPAPPDGPCLAIWGPQKGNAKLSEIADLGDGVEVRFKKIHGLQPGNKIAVFDIKVFKWILSEFKRANQ